MVRALLILLFVGSASIAATLYFGQEVLLALGLVAIQLKILGSKVLSIRLPGVVDWVKLHTQWFLQKDIWMKWVSGTLAPMVVGSALLRRMSSMISRAKASVDRTFNAMLRWYSAQSLPMRITTAAILIVGTLGATVSSLGLWVVFFSVQVPLWLVAMSATVMRSLFASVQKSLFRALALLKLGWLWSGVRRLVPEGWILRKKRWDRRFARGVIRGRRWAIRLLRERKTD